MKLLLFSDLHAHTYREFAGPPLNPANLNSRLENCLTALTQIRKYAAEHEIGYVIHAGDLFDKRNVIQTAMYNLVYREIVAFNEEDISLTLIAGNHDQTTLDGNVHSLEPMKSVATVVDKPTTFTFDDKLRVRCVPYLEKVEDFKTAVADGSEIRRGKQPLILVAHAGLAGATTGPVEYQPKEQLDPEKIKGYDFCFFGHYHKRQKLGEHKWYIGSPMQQNRGEREDKEKGFLVFDTDTMKFSTHRLLLPEFITAEVGGDYSDIQGNFVDLVGDPGPEFEKAKKDIGAVAAGVNPVYRPRATEARHVRVKLNPGMELDAMVKKYLKEFAPDEMDADHLMELTKQFLG